MPDATVSVLIELRDRLTSTAKRVDAAIGEIGNELKRSETVGIRAFRSLRNAAGRFLRFMLTLPRRIGRGLSTIFRRLTSIRVLITAIATGAVVRALARQGDAWQLLTNRIRAFVDSGEQAVAIQQELFRVAQRTRVPLSDTATVFQRLLIIQDDLGRSSKELIEFTESLSQSIIVSGVSSVESGAALLQLSQGLASGALRGDELRSVLEQLPFVAKIISDELGVSLGELRDLGFQGRITSEVILNAFENRAEQIQEQFDRTQATIGQSFTLIQNSAERSIGTLLQAGGAFAGIFRGARTVSQEIDNFTDVFANLDKRLVVGTRTLDEQGNEFVDARQTAAEYAEEIRQLQADLAFFTEEFGEGDELTQGILSQLSELQRRQAFDFRPSGAAISEVILSAKTVGETIFGSFREALVRFINNGELLSSDLEKSIFVLIAQAIARYVGTVLPNVLAIVVGTLVELLIGALPAIGPTLNSLFVALGDSLLKPLTAAFDALVDLLLSAVPPVLRALASLIQGIDDLNPFTDSSTTIPTRELRAAADLIETYNRLSGNAAESWEDIAANAAGVGTAIRETGQDGLFGIIFGNEGTFGILDGINQVRASAKELSDDINAGLQPVSDERPVERALARWEQFLVSLREISPILESMAFGFGSVISRMDELTELGTTLGTTLGTAVTDLSDSLIQAAINGENLGDVFRQWAVQVLTSIAQLIVQFLILSAISTALGIPPGVLGIGGAATSPFTRSTTPGGAFAGGRVRDLPPAQGFSEGGAVGGPPPPSPTTDNVPAMLQADEFVMKRKAAQHYGYAAMNAINSMLVPREALARYSAGGSFGSGTHFNAGGRVSGGEGRDSGSSGMNIAIVAPNEQSMQRLLAGGRNAMLAFMRENAPEVQSILSNA